MRLSILMLVAWFGVAIFVLALCRAGARSDRREQRFVGEILRAHMVRRAPPARRRGAGSSKGLDGISSPRTVVHSAESSIPALGRRGGATPAPPRLRFRK
jgi:hypothetical protein